MFLFGLGVAATNAYLVYLAVCEAEGVAKKDILEQRKFREELAEQLCKPELRKPVPPPREMERPSPARNKRKEVEASTANSSSAGKAGKLTWARVNKARAGFDASQHPFTDPIWRGTMKTAAKHRADCQWCKFKWIEDGRVVPDTFGGKKYEGPQNKEVMFCTKCGVHVCSASCWNEFHGI